MGVRLSIFFIPVICAAIALLIMEPPRNEDIFTWHKSKTKGKMNRACPPIQNYILSFNDRSIPLLPGGNLVVSISDCQVSVSNETTGIQENKLFFLALRDVPFRSYNTCFLDDWRWRNFSPIRRLLIRRFTFVI